MINLKKIDGTDIFEFSIEGKIDEAGMTALYNILKDKNREGKINLLAYLKDFDGFDNFKAFTEGLKIDLAVFGNLEKFAIITDKKWITRIAEIESKIFPGITMKGFRQEEEEKAIAWLKED